ncbi:MAG: hypothetical protein ABIH35_01375 [Patescibacteria group bacterium]
MTFKFEEIASFRKYSKSILDLDPPPCGIIVQELGPEGDVIETIFESKEGFTEINSPEKLVRQFRGKAVTFWGADLPGQGLVPDKLPATILHTETDWPNLDEIVLKEADFPILVKPQRNKIEAAASC